MNWNNLYSNRKSWPDYAPDQFSKIQVLSKKQLAMGIPWRSKG